MISLPAHSKSRTMARRRLASKWWATCAGIASIRPPAVLSSACISPPASAQGVA